MHEQIEKQGDKHLEEHLEIECLAEYEQKTADQAKAQIYWTRVDEILENEFDQIHLFLFEIVFVELVRVVDVGKVFVDYGRYHEKMHETHNVQCDIEQVHDGHDRRE